MAEELKIGKITRQTEALLGISLTIGNSVFVSNELLDEWTSRKKDDVHLFLLDIMRLFKESRFYAFDEVSRTLYCGDFKINDEGRFAFILFSIGYRGCPKRLHLIDVKEKPLRELSDLKSGITFKQLK